MKRLFLMAIAILFVFAFWTSAASAIDCQHGSGVYAQTCYHWPDASRSTDPGRNLTMYWSGFDAYYGQSVIRGANIWYNNPNGNRKVRIRTDIINGTSGCNANTNFVNFCEADFNESCGNISPGHWSGCVYWTVFTEWVNGSFVASSHIASAVVKLDCCGLVYDDGSPFTLTQNRRDIVACHEIGHVFGLLHTNSSPGTDSCFHWRIVEFGNDVYNFPGGEATLLAQALHSHNDGSCGPGCGYPNYGASNGTAGKIRTLIFTRSQLAKVHKRVPGVLYLMKSASHAESIDELFSNFKSAIGANQYGWPSA